MNVCEKSRDGMFVKRAVAKCLSIEQWRNVLRTEQWRNICEYSSGGMFLNSSGRMFVNRKMAVCM